MDLCNLIKKGLGLVRRRIKTHKMHFKRQENVCLRLPRLKILTAIGIIFLRKEFVHQESTYTHERICRFQKAFVDGKETMMTIKQRTACVICVKVDWKFSIGELRSLRVRITTIRLNGAKINRLGSAFPIPAKRVMDRPWNFS